MQTITNLFSMLYVLNYNLNRKTLLYGLRYGSRMFIESHCSISFLLPLFCIIVILLGPGNLK